MLITEKAKTAYDEFTQNARSEKIKARILFLNSHPDIAEVYSEAGLIWAKALKGEMSISECEQRQDILNGKLNKLLSPFGYNVSFLAEDHYCALCSDTGFFNSEPCICLKEFVTRFSLAESGRNELIKNESFDSFNLELFSDKTDESIVAASRGNYRCARDIAKYNLDVAKKFIGVIKQSGYMSLFISGGVGTGKTYLSHAVMGELISIGKSVIMDTAYNIVENLTDAALGKADKAEYDNLYECDLLIIDDLGCERQTDYSQMLLFNIINERLIRRRAMIINTNITAGELKKKYDERIVSRLIGEFGGLRTFGDDLRNKKNN